MSQNGANGLAKTGMNYQDILHFFYKDISITSLTEKSEFANQEDEVRSKHKFTYYKLQ